MTAAAGAERERPGARGPLGLSGEPKWVVINGEPNRQHAEPLL